MNKKIIFIIGVIITVLVVASLLILKSNGLNEDSTDCPMNIKKQYTMITDVNSDIAKTSRNILSKSGITEEYLNTHFSFICGVKYSEDNHRVAWRYKINDFETNIEGIINAPENVWPKFQKNVEILHDIKINMTKDIAEQKIESCLKEKPESFDIKLASGPKDFPNEHDKPEVNQKNIKGGLFMTRSIKSQDIKDLSLYHTKTAFLNLETEKCTVSKSSFYID